ncbi:MAG: AMP-binding protein [Gammaproteobacteria bacterium]|nr:AMP-binding protein [Gammaproteobacteria bacterium]
MTLLQHIRVHAAARPHATALSWASGSLDYAALVDAVDAAVAQLEGRGLRVLGLDLDNGPDWVVFDIAAMSLGICTVPLPAFFSSTQLRHALTQAGVQAVISDDPARLRARVGLVGDTRLTLQAVQGPLALLECISGKAVASLPAGVDKITFTSGTTGAPKGVLLGWKQMQAVARSLVDAVGIVPGDRHLALMPLAVLLENIGGVYAPLWAGAEVVLRGMREVGMAGAAGVDGARMAGALASVGATTAIFTPQTLLAVTEAIESSAAPSGQLRFAAVGGAPVSPRLLGRATAAGLPVFEGYGLSECASVVCLNTPQHNRPGSVGRPLPHTGVRIVAGEVVIDPCGFLGYLGDAGHVSDPWHSGDLGEIDGDGYLHLRGRRRNVFITAFGRNVAPEWVERELTLEPAIAQVAVFGEGQPFNVAVLTPAPGATPADLAAALARANRQLPDYARVTRWVESREAFSPANGLLTGTGRVRRDAVAADYRDAIESLYLEAQTS